MNKILEKIESDKEILSTMPRNNKKNIMKYAQNVENMQEEYEKIQQEIFNEMNNRYNEIISVKENKEIAIEKNEIDELEKLLDIINTVKTSYEKMGIDRKIYKAYQRTKKYNFTLNGLLGFDIHGKINLINLHRTDDSDGMPGTRGGKKRFNSDFKISGTAHTSGIKGVF